MLITFANPKPKVEVAHAPVEATTLAELIDALSLSTRQLSLKWELNYRTTVKRIATPTTIAISELQNLAEVLRVDSLALLALIDSQLHAGTGTSMKKRDKHYPNAKSLADLVTAGEQSAHALGQKLDIDPRTASKRISQPDTMLLDELFGLAEVLNAAPAEVFRTIQQEILSSPPPVRQKRGRAKGAGRLPAGPSGEQTSPA